MQVLNYYIFEDFPGSPVVKTPCFHCRGHGFCPWSRNRFSLPLSMAPQNCIFLVNWTPPPHSIVWPSLVILMLYVFRIQFSVANVITTVISLVLACGQSSGEREYGVHNLHSDVHTYTHRRVHIYLSWLKLWNFSFTFSLILWSSFFHTNNPCASGHIGW